MPTLRDKETRFSAANLVERVVGQLKDHGLVVVDPAGVVVWWNQAASLLTGFQAHEAIGRPLATLLPGEHDGDPGPPLVGGASGGWRRRKDRSLYWASLSTVQLEDGVLGVLLRDDTEHHRTERALQHSEERFRLLVERVEDYAIYLLDPDGRVASWNVGAERIKGYTAEEIVGEHLATFYPPDAVARGEPQWALNIASAEGRSLAEGWRIRKDGTRFWADTVITAMRDETGRLQGFSKVTRDMTQRKMEEEKFRVAVESAPNAMVMLDPGGRIVLFNRQAELLFGYERETIYGRSVEVLVPERARGRHPGFRADFAKAPQTRAMGAGRDLYGLRRDGTEIPIEIGLNPIQMDGGRFVLAAIVDITERKREQERFRATVESAPNPMVMVDRSGAIVLVNTQAELLFGYPREEMLGQPVEMLVPTRYHPGNPGVREGFFDAPAARPMGAGVDLFAVRKDGTEIPVEIGLNPLRTGDEDFVLAAIIDITERKRIEAEVRGLNAELEHRVAARTAELKGTIQELERFTYTVAHDLRAPLRTIHRYAELLDAREGAAMAAESREILVRVRSAASRMDRLTEDLLGYSRVSRADIAIGPVDVTVVVEEVLEGHAAPIDDEGTVFTIAPDIPAVNGDRFLLCVVLSNLVGNAVKFARPGVRPEVRIAGERLEGDRVRVSVADNGIGIDERFRSKIFQIFERLHTNDEYEGTGIGLAIATRAVERMGGTLGFVSAVGEGSKFWVELPAG